MKIQWIVGNINQIGGIERVVIQLSNYFVAHGCDTEIVSLCTTETNVYFEIHPEVEVIHWKKDQVIYQEQELLLLFIKLQKFQMRTLFWAVMKVYVMR